MMISLPQKQMCFLTKLTGRVPRPTEMAKSFRKVTYSLWLFSGLYQVKKIEEKKITFVTLKILFSLGNNGW